MSSMTETPNFWTLAGNIQLEKRAAKARRKNKPLKVYSVRDLQWYINHGWKVLSHNPSSYGRPQFWWLTPA